MNISAIVGQYGDMYKTVSVGAGGLSRTWMHVSQIPPVVFEQCRVTPVIYQDAETNTDSVSESQAGELDLVLPVRPLEFQQNILSSFKEVPNASVMQALIQPVKIYSIDKIKKTALVSYSCTSERMQMSWKDLIVLNPHLLASELVNQIE